MESFFNGVQSAFSALSYWELSAVILALLYLLLAMKENIWCWLAGFSSTLIYLFLFYQHQLFSETFLQIFYLAISIYGWLQWKKMDSEKGDKNVTTYSLKTHIYILGGGTFCTYLLGSFTRHYLNASLPFVDATTTVFAVITTYLVTQKKLENWLYWIVIDSISIYMYWYKGLYLTVLLFMIYVMLSFSGYFSWKKHVIYRTESI